jgi:hypothetical protein
MEHGVPKRPYIFERFDNVVTNHFASPRFHQAARKICARAALKFA